MTPSPVPPATLPSAAAATPAATPPAAVRAALPAAPANAVDSDGQPSFGTYSGAIGTVDLRALAAPHARGRVGRVRRLKRWVYAFASDDRTSVLAALIDTSYASTAFVMVTDLATGEVLVDRSIMGGPSPFASVNDHPAEGLEATFRAPTGSFRVRRAPGEDVYRMTIEIAPLRTNAMGAARNAATSGAAASEAFAGSARAGATLLSAGGKVAVSATTSRVAAALDRVPVPTVARTAASAAAGPAQDAAQSLASAATSGAAMSRGAGMAASAVARATARGATSTAKGAGSTVRAAGSAALGAGSTALGLEQGAGGALGLALPPTAEAVQQVQIELAMDAGGTPELSVIAPVDGGGSVNVTQKVAALPTTGTVTIDGHSRSLDGALGGLDYTHGYLARRTSWRWAFLVGTLDTGARIGLNLVEGFNETRADVNENALWLDDRLIPLDRARFAWDSEDPRAPWTVRTVDGSVDLTFHPVGVHSEVKDLVVISSRFVQPVGRFTGTVVVDGVTHDVTGQPGVTEDQDIRW